ncbi:hypothetical protein RRG08_052778 [Elysia crispata]|uniref:Uncharacterized protein n=1 Tax=Elysia crispata TaxID=231223 RepID=A0AAE1B704_9GAST|nr:hypothetical protein RRG08_052778 [Elysia crispata]
MEATDVYKKMYPAGIINFRTQARLRITLRACAPCRMVRPGQDKRLGYADFSRPAMGVRPHKQGDISFSHHPPCITHPSETAVAYLADTTSPLSGSRWPQVPGQDALCVPGEPLGIIDHGSGVLSPGLSLFHTKACDLAISIILAIVWMAGWQ